jgi:lysozyme
VNRDKLYADLVRDEGKKLNAYQDSGGYWTIGVGHLLGLSPRMLSITEDECAALLEHDIKEAEALLVPLFGQMNEGASLGPGATPNPERYFALVNMAFNLGNRLATFKKFIAAVNARDWAGAAHEMLNSLWAVQVKGRATRLAAIIQTGVDPV